MSSVIEKEFSKSNFQTEVAMDQEVIISYKQAMENYIEMYRIKLTDAGVDAEQAGYFLFFCIELSLDRMFSEGKDKIIANPENHYCAFTENFKTELVNGYMDILGAQQWNTWEKYIISESERFRVVLRDKILSYSKDILCPAFKGGLNEESVDIINKRCFRDYPQYPGERNLPVSKEEWFKGSVYKFNNLLIKECLVNIFLEEVEPLIKKKGMRWAGVSVRTAAVLDDTDRCLNWPMVYSLKPARTRENIEGK